MAAISLLILQGIALSRASALPADVKRNATTATGNSLGLLSSEACSDWHMYNGKCYTVLSTFEYFDTADDICKQSHARLASIHSEEENTFVYKLIRTYTREREAWIGLRTRHLELPMYWVDHTNVNYSNWVPTARPTDGRCTGVVAGGYWSGTICFYQRQAVCKRDKTEAVVKDDRIETALLYAIPVTCVLVMSAFVAYMCVRSYNELLLPTKPVGEDKPQLGNLADVAVKVCNITTERQSSVIGQTQTPEQSKAGLVLPSNNGLHSGEQEVIALPPSAIVKGVLQSKTNGNDQIHMITSL